MDNLVEMHLGRVWIKFDSVLSD